MQLEIQNCNNIDCVKLNIDESKLNILLAPNGTGKSTIANALHYGIEKDEDKLKNLLPFKYRSSNSENKTPNIGGIEIVKSIMCFNEEYVKNFVFKQDELLKNSFDILIKNDEYKKLEQEITELTKEIRELFINNKTLDEFLNDLEKLADAFKISKTGIAKTSKGYKGLSQGNKVANIPLGLEKYTHYIQSDNNITWVDWHLKGCEFIELDDNCPFCTAKTVDTKEIIKKVSTEYDKSTIANLKIVIDALENLGNYFSDDTKKTLADITKLSSGLDTQHESFFRTVIVQINGLIESLKNLKNLSAFAFSNDEKVEEKLDKYILKLEYFPSLNSDSTNSIVNMLNYSIQNLASRSGILQGKINIQRQKIQDLIENNKKSINGFLQKAGYKYEVDIVGEEDKKQLKLRHIEHSEFIVGGDQNLSFGERNAFAIVLFMYECLSKKPDIIILDDPISSFDKNKKYAIMQMLFDEKSNVSLQNKTVIMLTHDIEPIIDTIKSLRDIYINRVSASFLKLTKGEITQNIISSSDLQTFTQICKNTIASSENILIKLVYLRRECEIIDNASDAYEVLSNLFKKRERLEDHRSDKIDGKFPILSEEVFNNGCEAIKGKIPEFSYEEMLSKFKNISELTTLFHDCSNGYGKLQIFRIIVGDGIDKNDKEKSILRKFFNETFHVENEFIYQLDPNKFDTIPEYIIDLCNGLLPAE